MGFAVEALEFEHACVCVWILMVLVGSTACACFCHYSCLYRAANYFNSGYKIIALYKTVIYNHYYALADRDREAYLAIDDGRDREAYLAISDGRDREACLAISDGRDREAYPGIWQRSGGLPWHMAEIGKPTLP